MEGFGWSFHLLVRRLYGHHKFSGKECTSDTYTCHLVRIGNVVCMILMLLDLRDVTLVKHVVGSHWRELPSLED